MDNLTVSLENHLTFRDKETGKIVAIEQQNGHLERYGCEIMSNQKTNQLFGADKPPAKLTRNDL